MRTDPTIPDPENEALSAWLDGELDPDAAAALEAELARDPALRAEVAQLEAVIRTMRVEGPLSAPEGFEARLMARVEAEAPQESGWRAWLRRPFGVPLEGWALGLAVAAACLLLVPVWRAAPDDEGAPHELSPAAVEPPAMGDARDWAEQAPPVAAEAPAPVEEPPPRKGVSPAPAPVAAAPVPVPPVGTSSEGTVEPQVSPDAGTSRPEVLGLGPEPHQLLVRTDSTAVKVDLLRICARHRWDCVTSDVANDGKMRASREVVHVHLPSAELNALAQELAALGHDVQRIGTDALVKGEGSLDLVVVLQLVGSGASDAPVTAPQAARAAKEREQMQLDEVEQAAPPEAR
ncbi:MAG: hypothetical protein R3F59_03140 [Myxococcota bacterium]